MSATGRGNEIKEWLDTWGDEVTKFAILDDDTESQEQHGDNYFRTFFNEGLTEETANQVIEHLNR